MRRSDWIALGPVFLRSLGRLPLRHLLYMAKMLRWENPQIHKGRRHINAFFPSYPSPVFDRFLQAVHTRQRIPYSTYVAVTGRCPYQCEHCSYGKHTGGEMSTEQAIEVIRQIHRIGGLMIGFTGGEPMLRTDLPELIAAVPEDMESVLFTTGYAMTRERVRELADAGLDCMMIGIESDQPARQDAIRGVPGSWLAGYKAIEYSVTGGLFTSISTMASREKVESGELLRMAKVFQDMGVREFRILDPVATGTMLGRTDVMLDEPLREQVRTLHKQWNRRNGSLTISSFSHLESDEMFGCGAGYHHLYIDAAGDVSPCDLTPLSFGNVREENLADIWKRMGRWFGKPRQGCLMRALIDRGAFNEVHALPIDKENSEKMVSEFVQETPRPGIYENYLKK